jgi:nucleotide-binding universal stress UspA family protein
MYKQILMTLEVTPTDRAIIAHIKSLAQLMHSRVTLLHVADGWAARTFGCDAISPEITEDTAYLHRVRDELRAAGIETEIEMAYGDPATEIIRWVRCKPCDLVAMSTHGHRFFGELIHGTTAMKVQHSIDVPVLLLRTRTPAAEPAEAPTVRQP